MESDLTSPAVPASASAPPGTESADGQWIWDGAAWRPVARPGKLAIPAVKVGRTPISISPGEAFKFGFFAFWGFVAAGFVPWIILAIVITSIVSASHTG